LKRIKAGDDEDDTLLLLSLVYEGEGRLLAGQEMLSKARLSYEKALELSEKGHDNDERRSSLLGYLGTITAMQNETDVAQGYLEKALAIARKNDYDNLPSILVNLGMLKMFKGALTEARHNCKEAFNLSHKQKDSETESQAVHCLDEINRAFKK
jgi:tetratricopeptide (TPR) repeat protein